MNYRNFNLGDWIGHISGVIEDEPTLDGNEMKDLVEFLTTLKQEPKTGHWINIDDIESKCSECGHREPNERFIFEDINFCAKCGVRMENEQNE